MLPPFASSGAQGASEGDYLAASAEIRRRAGWHIWPRINETVTLNPRGARLLFLPTMRLHSITAMVVEGVALDDAGLQGLRWTSSGIVERSAYAGWLWPWAPRSVTVTMNHGEEYLPSDLELLCRQMAGSAALVDSGNVKSKSMGGRQVVFVTASDLNQVNAAGDRILNQYKLEKQA
jgi:hypothetical protein